MPIEPHLYKSVNMDLAQQVEVLKSEVNERDAFIQKMLKTLAEIAPLAAMAVAAETPEHRRYEL